MKNYLNRKSIALFIASFWTYQRYLSGVLLANFFATFSDLSQNTVLLLYTVPTLLAAATAFALAPFMKRISKKMVICSGLLLIIVAGVIIEVTGGTNFALTLCGTSFTGIGFALVYNGTNIALTDMFPDKAGTAIAINNAVGCLGNMIIMAAGGVLAKGGDWTHSYWLCFPTIICFIIFVAMYREEKHVPIEQGNESTESTVEKKLSFSGRSFGLFIAVLVCQIGVILYNNIWNANSAVYVITEKQFGTTVEVGMLSSIASAASLVGGFVLAGLLIPRLKQRSVPVSMVFMLPLCIAASMGCKSVPVFYIFMFISSMFGAIVFAENYAAAGKLMGPSGVTLINGVQSVAAFLAPYIANFIGSFGDGTTHIKFVAAVIIAVIGVVVSVIVMPKVAKINTEQ